MTDSYDTKLYSEIYEDYYVVACVGWKADARWCDNENQKSYYPIDLT
jgi:hypothetical protein